MKKILFAALAILGLAAPVGAAVPTSGHAYKLKHKATNLWLNTEIMGRKDEGNYNCASLESNEKASVVYLMQNPDNENQWQFRTNVQDGKTLSSAGTWRSVIDGYANFYWYLTEQEDGSVSFSRDASQNYLAPNANAAVTNCVWTNKGANNDIQWILEEVPTYEVTYSFPLNKREGVIKTSFIVPEGKKASDYVIKPESFGFFTITGYTPANTVVSATNKDFTVSGTWNYPIEAGHVYRMKLRPSETGSKYMHFDGTNANLNYTDVQETDFSTDFFWYFTAGTMNDSGLTPVTLHSMSMLDNQGMEFATGDNSIGVQSSNPTVWYIRKSNVATAGQKDFILQHSGNASDNSSTFINYRDGKVSTWATSLSNARGDNGCVFRAYDLLDSDWEELGKNATQEEIDAAKASPTVENIKALIAKMSVPAEDVQTVLNAGDYIDLTLNLGSDADKKEWRDFKATITDVNNVNPTTYALLTSAVHSFAYNVSLHIPESGKPMKFRHKLSSTDETPNYLGINAGNLQSNGEVGKRIFTMKPAPNNAGFYLYNEYAGKYVNFPSTLADSPSTVYVLDMYSDFGKPSFGLRKATGTGNIFLHNGGENNNIVASIKNAGSEWVLETATPYEVTSDHLLGAITDRKSKGAALASLVGVCSSDAIDAWNAKVSELNNATLYTNEMLTSLNTVYNGLQKNVNTVSITVKHKNTGKYISANNSGNVVCEDTSDEGTRALTLSMAEDGTGFNIFSEYAGKYITHATDDNHSTGLTSDKSQASVYNLDVYDTSGTNSFLFGKVDMLESNSNRAYLHTNNALHHVTRWNNSAGSAWYIEIVTDDEAADQFLNGAKAPYAGMSVGNGMGQYKFPNNASTNAVSNALNKTQFTDNDDKRTAGRTLRNYNASDLTLNMPQPGHIYMFSNIDGTKYLSSDLSTTVTDHPFADMIAGTQENLLSRLFYLDSNYHLVALKDGKVMGACLHGDESNSWHTVLVSNTAKAGVFTFSEAATKGKYVIAAQGGDNRNLYNDTDGRINCGGGPAEVGYHWTIEEKTGWFPLTGSNNDKTTIVLPFAMQTRDGGMKLYTATQANDKVILTEFTDRIIPANTPFIVDFNGVQRDPDNHLVYLQKADSAGNVPANNILQGSIYAVENQGYATRSGNKFENSTETVINGFSAYLPGGELRTMSNTEIEAALDGLAGKVFALKNTDTDTSNNRGYLIYQEGKDAVWTSGKAGIPYATANTNYAQEEKYHWTLVKDANGRRYLYNIAAGKFAACYAKSPEQSKNVSEFNWHFSDYPTAIDFYFYDYNQTTDLATAVFNIIGGENSTTYQNRPCGFLIANNYDVPVHGICGLSADDGCGFRIKVVEDANAGEVASADAALEKMLAEHTEATDYIANHSEDFYELPGHYNRTGYNAFYTALQNEAADTQGKYYQLVRARNAAGDSINKFQDNGIYVFGEIYANSYVNPKTKEFYITVEDHEHPGINTDETTGTSNVWQCQIDANNKVNFIHTFTGYTAGWTEVDHNPMNPMAARARFSHTVTANGSIDVQMFDESVTPIYKNAYGDIEAEGEHPEFKKTLNVSQIGKDEDLVTTSITEITATDAGDAKVYDLQGRRVGKAGRGLYIVNGKKTLIR